jgi:GntR family transcriptional regulator
MWVVERAGLNVPHDIKPGTIRAMAGAGIVEVGHVEEITARMPTPDESLSLDLGTGVPVLEYVRVAYTQADPVRLTRTIFAADRNRLVNELGDLSALDSDGAT